MAVSAPAGPVLPVTIACVDALYVVPMDPVPVASFAQLYSFWRVVVQGFGSELTDAFRIRRMFTWVLAVEGNM